MQRREFLAGVVAAGSIAIAGCGSSGGSGPERVVEEYVNALSDGDTDRLEELTHQDAPGQALQAMGGEFGSQVDISASNISTVDQEIDASADQHDNVQSFELVELDITTAVEVGGQENETTQTVTVIVAQNTDGDWKIWR